jgi:hypothetical protein
MDCEEVGANGRRGTTRGTKMAVLEEVEEEEEDSEEEEEGQYSSGVSQKKAPKKKKGVEVVPALQLLTALALTSAGASLQARVEVVFDMLDLHGHGAMRYDELVLALHTLGTINRLYSLYTNVLTIHWRWHCTR